MRKGVFLGAMGIALLGVAGLLVLASPYGRSVKALGPTGLRDAPVPVGSLGSQSQAPLCPVCEGDVTPHQVIQLKPFQSLFTGPAFDRKVSVTFQSARVADVLKWLEVEGINFVADPRSFGEGRVISLSVKDQPLRDVLNAVARALNAHWEREGNIYILKPGAWGRGVVLPQFPRMLQGDLQKRITELIEKDRELLRKHREIFEKGLQEDLQKRITELLEKHKEILGEGGLKVLPRVEAGRSFVFRANNLQKLMDSLTKEQWDLHSRQGYLRVEDLTPQQRELLGTLPQAPKEWVISVTINGRTLTLKSG